jgi:hypothetical protein
VGAALAAINDSERHNPKVLIAAKAAPTKNQNGFEIVRQSLTKLLFPDVGAIHLSSNFLACINASNSFDNMQANIKNRSPGHGSI